MEKVGFVVYVLLGHRLVAVVDRCLWTAVMLGSESWACVGGLARMLMIMLASVT